MADRIQQRRDTAARWAEYNPVLLEGEIGIVTDNPNQYKIGDGVHAWNDLPLRGYNGTIVQETGNDENAVMSQKAVTDLINSGYLFKGIASPDTDPGTPDGKICYMAIMPGDYTNFDMSITCKGLYLIYRPSISSEWSFTPLRVGTFDLETSTEICVEGISREIFNYIEGEKCESYKELSGYFIYDNRIASYENDEYKVAFFKLTKGIPYIIEGRDINTYGYPILGLMNNDEGESENYILEPIRFNEKSNKINMFLSLKDDAILVVAKTPKSNYPDIYKLDRKESYLQELEKYSLFLHPESLYEASQIGEISSAFISVNGVISNYDNENYSVKYYKVEKGKVYVIKGENVGAYNYPIALFVDTTPTKGVTGEVIGPIYSANQYAENYYRARYDGYICVSKSATSDYPAVYVGIISDKDIVYENGSSVLNYDEIPNAFINSSGGLSSFSSTNDFRIRKYAVSKGRCYRVFGIDCGTFNLYPAVAFSKDDLSIGGSTDVILYIPKSQNEDIKFLYIPEEDGYLYVAGYTKNHNIASLFYAKRIFPDNNKVQDKVLAVIGDSIMMIMSSIGVGGNTITYRGSDGNAYEFGELTNINGLLYVTDTLSSGSVVNTTVSIEIENSVQENINNENWEDLRVLLNYKDVINQGQGGAKYSGTQIDTSYPSHGAPNGINTIPNQVRALKRLTDSGKREVPNYIMLWAGTNDFLSEEPDDFDEIMNLTWKELSAQTSSGLAYRATFYGGVRYSFEYLIRNFPDATIFVFSPVQSNSGSRNYNNIRLRGNCLKKMAERFSCIFIDACTQIGICDIVNADKWYYDGLHPNDDGKKLFANYVERIIKNNSFDK